MITALKNSIDVPVSVKIRLGNDATDTEKIIYQIIEANLMYLFLFMAEQFYRGTLEKLTG